MARFFRLLLLSAGLLPGALALAQEEPRLGDSRVGSALEDRIELVNEGNKLLAKGWFGAALPIWQQLLADDPSNANTHFKVGLCYHHSIDEQVKALQHFKVAVGNMHPDYNFNGRAESTAPYDALYFLGETYLAANEPDSALDRFLEYQNHFNGQPPIPVDRQILMCVNARRASRNRRDVTIKNLGETINSEFAETNPVLTIDNSVIFFASRRLRDREDGLAPLADPITGKYQEDIYLAQRGEDGEWAISGLFNLSSDISEAPLFLSADGLTLYLRREEKGNVDLFTSQFRDGVWAQPLAVGGVNSKANEIGVSVDGAGQYLYFSSNREGGQGNYDLYRCEKRGNGKWGKPENISARINTPFNEVSPFIHPDGKTLFFSSDGYRNRGMGGFDIYYTELQADGSWSDPTNMGYPINSTRDDINYYITEGGSRYYAAVNKDQSYDLYQITGGGFDVENVDVGTEVVTLTQEMSVTEVLELEKEVEKEVEVVEFVEIEAPPLEEDDGVEEVDLTVLDELEGLNDLPLEDVDVPGTDELGEEGIDETALEEETIDLDVDAIDMDRLDSADRVALITKVTAYLQQQAEVNQAVDSRTVYFKFSSRGLNRESREVLADFKRLLNTYPDSKVAIVGHTDNRGQFLTNVTISRERAWEVYTYLARQGIPRSRMIYYGMSDLEPVAGNDYEEGRALNRRVTVSVLK